MAHLFSNRRSAAVILTALLTLPAFGADASLWSNLGGLKRGARIGIIQSNQKRIEGQFEGATDSEISLRTDQVVTLPKDAVVRGADWPARSEWWAVITPSINVPQL